MFGTADTTASSPPRQAQATQRLWEVDTLRGVAVVLMVFFHFMWNLDYFGLFGGNILSPGWQIFARGIGSTFAFLLGVSLVLDDARRGGVFSMRPYLLRGAKIFGYGLIISAVTYVAVGSSFVIFGILHMLGTAMVLAAPFVRRPAWVSLATGAAMIVTGALINSLLVGFPWLIWLGLKYVGFQSVDYYPVLPWAGMAFLGVFVGRMLYNGGKRQFRLPDLGSWPLARALRLLGRHSLVIYLAHQPLILAGFYVLGYRP